MQLNWMGKYRNFLEQLIRFGNLYAQAYKVEDSYTEIPLSLLLKYRLWNVFWKMRTII